MERKKQEVVEGVKSIDNWFSQHTSNKTDWKEFHNSVMNKKRELSSLSRPKKQASEQRYDKKFVEFRKSIGLPPEKRANLGRVTEHCSVTWKDLEEQCSSKIHADTNPLSSTTKFKLEFYFYF